MGAARGLAVDGDEGVPVRPQRCHPTLEAATEQNRINPIDQRPQPAGTRNAVMEFGKFPQEVEMMVTLGDDVVEIVARSDGGARRWIPLRFSIWPCSKATLEGRSRFGKPSRRAPRLPNSLPIPESGYHRQTPGTPDPIDKSSTSPDYA
jgi:hypothetical protein